MRSWYIDWDDMSFPLCGILNVVLPGQIGITVFGPYHDPVMVDLMTAMFRDQVATLAYDLLDDVESIDVALGRWGPLK